MATIRPTLRLHTHPLASHTHEQQREEEAARVPWRRRCRRPDPPGGGGGRPSLPRIHSTSGGGGISNRKAAVAAPTVDERAVAVSPTTRLRRRRLHPPRRRLHLLPPRGTLLRGPRQLLLPRLPRPRRRRCFSSSIPPRQATSTGINTLVIFEKMACSICFDLECKRESLQSFNLFIIGAKACSPGKAIVRCKARSYFNTIVGDKFEMVSWRGFSYTINVDKRTFKTVLEGDWSMFAAVHDIVDGDSIVMLYEPKIKGFRCLPIDNEGVEKFPDGLDAIPPERKLSSCLYTSGQNNLSTDEKTKILQKMYQIKQPSLRLLVHRLTSTNVAKFILKLPKRVAEMLQLLKNGLLVFKLGRYGICHYVNYMVSTDGRAACKWEAFVESCYLEAGQIVIFAPSFDGDVPVVTVHSL